MSAADPAARAATVEASAGGHCQVARQADEVWPGGFSATVTITLPAATGETWSARWDAPAGQSVTQAWGADVGQIGNEVLADGPVAPAGAPVRFGIVGTGSPDAGAGTRVTVDGVPCTVVPAGVEAAAKTGGKITTKKCRTKKNGNEVCKTITKKAPKPTTTSPAPTTSGPGQQVYAAGFESGSTDGWTARGPETVAVTTAAAHSGQRSLQTTGRTSAWNGPSKDLTSVLVPGRSYTVSAYARLTSGAAATTVNLTAAETSGGTTSYRPVTSAVAVTDQNWVALSGTYTLSTGVDAVAIYAESASTTASFLLDDVTVSTDGSSPTTTSPTTTTTSPTTTTTSPTSTLGTADLTIDPATRYQKIDGFGAALPIWPGSANGMLTTDEIHKLVGMGDGELGLSIVRTMLSHDTNAWPFAVSNLKEAKAYGSGVKILASPWTAPANFKSNNSLTGGGKLKTDYYDDYANHLNAYVQYMRNQGVAIDVTSVQNEPDWHPNYDSMDWSGDELKTFVRDYGGRVQNTKLMVAESLNTNRAMTDPTLYDATASNNIGYIGGHLYGAEESGRLSPYPLAAQKQKPVWMTEWNFHEVDGNGSSIWRDASSGPVWDETLDKIMRTVHKSMESDWSAYIWWYGRRYYSFIGDGESAYGTTKGAVLKRGWAFSQFAKYVRPGDERVALTKGSKASPLEVTAYVGHGKTTLVILNRSTSAVSNLVVQVPQSVSAAQYTLTSQYSSRATQPVTVSGGRVGISVPARSISTLVLTTS